MLDSNRDKFGRPERGNSNQHDKASVFDVRLGHGRLIAFCEPCLFGLRAEQSAAMPFVQQKIFYLRTHALPQRDGVWFENDPLQTVRDGLFDISHVATRQ